MAANTADAELSLYMTCYVTCYMTHAGMRHARAELQRHPHGAV
jgi:hypothetical protein